MLAALAAERFGRPVHERVVERWLERLSEALRSGALEFGPTGPLSGLAAAMRVVPRLRRVSDSLWEQLAEGLPRDCWRTSAVRWFDYDLVRGPTGLLLSALAGGRRPSRGAAPRRALAERCVRHLLLLCDDELAAFRLGGNQGDPRLKWGEGRINTGVAHGVAGVALALAAALEHGVAPTTRIRVALARIADGLVARSYVDRTGLRAWPHASLDGDAPSSPAPPPQAWCYGTPGIAWALWESGRVLGRRDVATFALAAMESWCERVEPGVDRAGDVPAQLGLCHGIAGTLALADAFARSTGLPAAARKAKLQEELLLRNLSHVEGMGADRSLLTGAPGVLSLLLTRAGADRRWLIPFGLR
ncbi:MAG TPA: lanthionine synthetase LanC family protein [Planctomycetota bacterium]|nr:lanthionine synthetase LanC family protein [Planctomycetota bacterium]